MLLSGYQTLEFHGAKTGQAFDFKFGMCVRAHIMYLVNKFDQNLKISGVESEILLKLVKYFEMNLLQSRERKQFR